MTEPTRDFSFECDGARLHAWETGAGRPLLFVHGGLADHRAALFHVGRAATSLRVITPDLRGAGRSVWSGALGWDRFAGDLRALLDHLAVERAIVGGTSMGAGVALRFALRHPDRLSGLVLASPLYPGADRGLPEAARVAMRFMDVAGQRTLTDGIDALRPLFAALPEPVRSVALEMTAGFDPASVAATTRFLATDAQPLDRVEELGAIDVPVLIVPGADPQHPAEVAELYAKHVRRPVVRPAGADLAEEVVRFAAGL